MKADKNYFAEVFGCKSFNVSHYLKLLKFISDDKRYTNEIAEVLEMSGTGVYKIASALEKRGYVYRLFWGRYRYVKLTEKGKELLSVIGE